ncbi:MAG TPA: efflux RND transporter periplasmic adaptor subunit, partial [Alphaproteobacteria bacterium]|nr:efflux RND transporter periplasmic adaptor subunit [Alphaproteobacteria bacterium]
SPISGIVQHRDAEPGETIGPDDTPFTVVNTDEVWLFVDLFERHITKVAAGQSVQFSARALSDRNFAGTIDWVSRSLDEEARTVRVRATMNNPDDILRDGMFGTARINTKSDQRLALVPVDAVQTLQEDSVVFVPGKKDGAFRAQTVTLGQESEGVVEIQSGLEPGADVVLSGAFDLMSALTASGRSAAHSH